MISNETIVAFRSLAMLAGDGMRADIADQALYGAFSAIARWIVEYDIVSARCQACADEPEDETLRRFFGLPFLPRSA